MDVLFLHPNFPGQFRRLAAALAREPEVQVWGMGDQAWVPADLELPGVRLLRYPHVPEGVATAHPWSRNFERAVRRGDQVIRTLAEHKRKGLEPDVIVAHPGWGDAFFVRDFFPGARVVGYFEYYYRVRGADVGFDPEFPAHFNDIFRLHADNATQLLALESCDAAVCPTRWQKGLFPPAYDGKLRVQHEGIDTMLVQPDPQAEVRLRDGRALRQGNEVLTYVSRNLEPYRGFHVFMRALPRILRERPDCQVLVVGAEGTSYGPAPRSGGSWKEVYLNELRNALDLNRVHFTGILSYGEYLKVLQVSRVHVYLTYPFILSWSLLEAMAAGCVLVASDTAPVSEFLQDGVSGRLFAFRDHERLATLAIDALANPENHAHLAQAARQTVVERMDFEAVALPAYRRLLDMDVK